MTTDGNSNIAAPVDPEAQREADLAAAKQEYALAMRSVGQSLRILDQELGDLEEAMRALGNYGAFPQGYPVQLAQAVKRTLSWWQHIDAGRAALGLGPGMTWDEQCLQNARHDLKAAEELLAQRKALPVTPDTAADRKRMIEEGGAHVIRLRKRVAQLEGSPVDSLKSWLRGFVAEVKRAADAPVIVEREHGKQLLAIEAREEAQAEAADPLGTAAKKALEA